MNLPIWESRDPSASGTVCQIPTSPFQRAKFTPLKRVFVVVIVPWDYRKTDSALILTFSGPAVRVPPVKQVTHHGNQDNERH